MTIFVTLQLIVTLDSIRNSCDVYFLDIDGDINSGIDSGRQCRIFDRNSCKCNRLPLPMATLLLSPTCELMFLFGLFRSLSVITVISTVKYSVPQTTR